MGAIEATVYAEEIHMTNDHHHSKNSYELVHGEQILSELQVRPGDIVLDLGCGPGEYTLRAAAQAGPGGQVFAVDQNPEALDTVREKAAKLGLNNITILQQDFCAPIPLHPGSVNAMLLCTVLHHPAQRDRHEHLFDKICPLLHPEGRMVIVEIQKKETLFGPPQHMRMAAEELEPLVLAHSMQRTGYCDLDAAYLLRFKPV